MNLVNLEFPKALRGYVLQPLPKALPSLHPLDHQHLPRALELQLNSPLHLHHLLRPSPLHHPLRLPLHQLPSLPRLQQFPLLPALPLHITDDLLHRLHFRLVRLRFAHLLVSVLA